MLGSGRNCNSGRGRRHAQPNQRCSDKKHGMMKGGCRNPSLHPGQDPPDRQLWDRDDGSSQKLITDESDSLLLICE